jgi:hypothetical protein
MEEMEGSLNTPEDDSDISELMRLVTKKYSDRNRTLLEFLYELSNIDYEDVSFHHKWKALMVKMADRLDNARTVVIDPNKNVSKISKQIHDETAQIYREIAFQNGMVNVEDWYIDYLREQNLFERGIVRGVDYAAERETGMKARFVADFQKKLELEYPEASFGKNYWIEFRPVGIRHLDIDDPDLSQNKYGVYSQKFRSYIMFFPIGNQPRGLAIAADNLFSDIFSGNVDVLSDALDSSLGQIISERTDDRKVGGVGFDEKSGYGVGVWAVFDNQRRALADLLGDFHLSYFYDDKEAASRILDNFSGISPEIEKLMNFYDMVVLDLVDRVENEPKLQSLLDFCVSEFSEWVKGILGDG